MMNTVDENPASTTALTLAKDQLDGRNKKLMI